MPKNNQAKSVRAKSITPKKSASSKASHAKAAPRGDLKASEKKSEVAEVLSSEIVYQGPLFRVQKERILEPEGKENVRDVIRHNGSVVILALDTTKSKKDPWIVMERQYRHAANRYLWELPAGKIDAGEEALAGAQRELEEETGYRAKKWKPMVEYFASPGFLGESFKVFTAEGLIAGDAHPEDDEHIELRLVKLSEVLKKIDKGEILDGKTLSVVLLYQRQQDRKRSK